MIKCILCNKSMINTGYGNYVCYCSKENDSDDHVFYGNYYNFSIFLNEIIMHINYFPKENKLYYQTINDVQGILLINIEQNIESIKSAIEEDLLFR